MDKNEMDEAYMQDAIATAKQFGAVVKDMPPKNAHIIEGDDAAIEEHIQQGLKRGTITDATPSKPAVGKFTQQVKDREARGPEQGHGIS